MSHLQFCRAALLHYKIASVTCCVACCNFVAKQELINQRSSHFRDKVAQNRALLSCVTVAKFRDTPCHTCDFCHVIKLHNKIARYNCRCECDIGLSFCRNS